MDTKQKITDIKQQMAVLTEARKECGRQIIKELTATVFTQYPEIESFGWTQYTPYFNDGDTCEFWAHVDTDNLYINGKDHYEDNRPSVMTQPKDWVPHDDIKYYRQEPVYQAAQEEHLRSRAFINQYLNLIDQEDFQSIYGDHMRITVFRDRVETEEYSHD